MTCKEISKRLRHQLFMLAWEMENEFFVDTINLRDLPGDTTIDGIIDVILAASSSSPPD